MPDYEQALNQYRAGKRCGASAADQLILVYEEAISSCYRQDADGAHNAICALSRSLDYRNQAALAKSLSWVYHHCQVLLHRKNFEGAALILAEIRDALKASRDGAL
jgi:flagellin-specific chaperone FliS